MFLDVYNKFNSFNEQIIFLTNNLNKDIVFEDIKKNLRKYILNTKFNNSKDFINFYTLIKTNNELITCFNNNIITILELNCIDLLTLYEILNSLNYNAILNNEIIQQKLVKIIYNHYSYSSLKIINKFIKKNKKTLFLNQIQCCINKLAKDVDKEIIYNLITCIINDPMFNNNFNYKASGSYKDCFVIGKYILKIGLNIQTNKLPKSKNFLSPIFYKTFNDLTVAIYPLVKTPILPEERNLCWFNIRDEKIIVFDSNNILNYGKFPKDFKHPFSNLSEQSKINLGINNILLNNFTKGEIVCIDYDFAIYDDDESLYATALKTAFYYEFKNLNNLYNKYKRKEKRLQI